VAVQGDSAAVAIVFCTEQHDYSPAFLDPRLSDVILLGYNPLPFSAFIAGMFTVLLYPVLSLSYLPVAYLCKLKEEGCGGEPNETTAKNSVS
jgi:hypothetical protein